MIDGSGRTASPQRGIILDKLKGQTGGPFAGKPSVALLDCVGLCVSAGWPLAEPDNLTGIGGWAGWKEGGGGGGGGRERLS